jgi:hypothetical protein
MLLQVLTPLPPNKGLFKMINCVHKNAVTEAVFVFFRKIKWAL